jgi:hypothetical protein
MLRCCESVIDIVVRGSTAWFHAHCDANEPNTVATAGYASRERKHGAFSHNGWPRSQEKTGPTRLSPAPRQKAGSYLHWTCEHHDQESKLEFVLKLDALSILPHVSTVTDRPGLMLEASHIDCTPEPHPVNTEGSDADDGVSTAEIVAPLVSDASDMNESDDEEGKLSKRREMKLNMLAPHGKFGRNWPVREYSKASLYYTGAPRPGPLRTNEI